MTSVKVSVVVPVYNVEPYLENTVYSIINQSIFEDIEVLLIDDGSSDGSRHLVEEFSCDYDNIKCFHKENEGLSITRNLGIELAKGEYIHFMDSDDYLPSYAYEKMYVMAKKHDHDMVSGRYLRFNTKSIWNDDISNYLNENIPKTTESTSLEKCKHLSWDSVVWNKLYKTSFLNDNTIRFPDERITFEDNIFSIESYAKAKSVGFLNDTVYYWRMRENNDSLSQSDLNRMFIDRIKIMHMVNDAMEDNNCNADAVNLKYLKWLNLDLKFMVFDILTLEKSNQPYYLKKAKEVLNLGPKNLLDELDDYKRILYNIVMNQDLDDLFEFKRNYSSERLMEKYGFHSFKKDLVNSKLKTSVNAIKESQNSLIINYNSHIPFSRNEEYETAAKIVNTNQSRELACDENQIRIDYGLIDSGLNRIIITKKAGDIVKEEYLKTSFAKTIELNDCYLELAYSIDNILYIYKRLKNVIDLKIKDIILDDEYIIFKNLSNNHFKNIDLINPITLEKYDYEVDEHENNLKIPYSDLLKSPIKNWILEIEESHDKMFIQKRHDLFKNNNRISLNNHGDKVNITVSEIDKIKLLNDLTNEIANANKKNRKLIQENTRLKENLDEFKSRKVVRFVDKVKRIL